MALVIGQISGSVQTNSVIGVTGSLVIASKPEAQFPSLDSGIKFLVDEASLFKSTVVSSGSLTVKNSVGSPSFTVVASSGDTTVGGTFSSVGAATFTTGLSGSITRLANGTSYLVAGTNVTITSASNGQVTVSSTGGGGSPGGSDTQIQFNNAGSFGGAEGVTYTTATYTLGADNLSVTGSSGLSVLQTATISGLANLNGGIAVDTSNFTVDGTNGNVSTQGSLGVLGAASLSSTLSVVGNITGQGTNNQLDALAVTGSAGVTITADLAVNGGDITSSASSFNLLNATVESLFIGGAATTIQIGSTSGTTAIKNALTVDGNVTLGNATGDLINFTGRAATNLLPSGDVSYNLGSDNLRWANIYTGDLHLRNERGDYTLIEEEEMLTIRFNKTGKRYKFLLEAVPELDEEPALKF